MSRSPAPGSHYGFGRKLLWLVRREWWENRGSFFTAPLIAATLSLLLFTLLLGIIQVLIKKVGRTSGEPLELDIVGFEAFMRGEAALSPEQLDAHAAAVNTLTLSAATWPMVVLGFAVLFYLLASLYDDRSDRSILLWKSLPLSDTQTVLSKFLSAMVVAPLSAVAVSLLAMLGMVFVMSAFILINGGNPLLLYWQHLSPGFLLGSLVGWLPVYILWAMPTVGWLMLCSAWARSVPFLWAVLIPLLSGITASMFSILGYSPGNFWYYFVLRLVTGVFPGSHMLAYIKHREALPVTHQVGDDPSLLIRADGLLGGWPLFAVPELWLGVVAGLAMMAAAIALRRWRHDY